MKDMISVVIPCYNAEKYIEKCVDSIIGQTYRNLEVIIVNDGSTDSTKQKIEKYLQDERVVYIEQSNGGEYSARNTGLMAATGTYIGFVDADDFIAPIMYERMYNALDATNADMAVCNFNQVYENEIKMKYSSIPTGVFNIQEDVYGYWLKVCASAPPNNYVWTRLYKREIVIRSGVIFENYPHSADTLFNFKLLPHLKKAVFVNEGLYNYVQRRNSGIHTIALKRNLADLYADTFQALVDYYLENQFTNFLSVLPIHAYSRMKSVFFYSRLAGETDEEIVSSLIYSWKNRDIFKYLTGK